MMAENKTTKGNNIMVERTEFNTAISALHAKLDKNKDVVTDALSQIQRTLIEVQTIQSYVKIPDRPCTYFTAHEENHKKTYDTWTKPLVVAFIVTIFIFVQEPIKAVCRGFFSQSLNHSLQEK